jgi:hypothetical protein
MHHVRLMTLSILALFCTAFTLFQSYAWNIDMRPIIPLGFGSIAAAQNATIDLKWHAPRKSWINDLGQVINATGTNGFVFNSSQTPAGTPYGTYNWCNMPHVRAQEYPEAHEEFELLYVEV